MRGRVPRRYVRAPGCAALGAGERLHVERERMCVHYNYIWAAGIGHWVRAQISPENAGSLKAGLLNVVAGFFLLGLVILVRENRRA